MTPDPRNDQQLRAAFATLSRDAEFTAACPASEQLWAGARGDLAPGEVESLAVHMADCGACAEAWRLAREFGAPAQLAAPARAFPWWLPAAAVIMLASGATLFYVTRPPGATVAPTTANVAPAVPTYRIPVEKAPIKVSTRYALTWRGPTDGRAFLEALKTALEPYERADYPAAVATLTELTTRYRDTAEPALYLGVSHLMAGDAAAAIAPLEHARDLAEREQREDVTWFLAAAYERAGRAGEAQRLAQAVCDGQGARAGAGCAAAAALRGR